ncbi:hypothetical protein [Ensifer sp. WSM1721]|uniref:hypothetical protein n=1 Tax=Ensifer sp. WSM1721 TaxID=1041159 RepID=UPI0012EB84C8|nr:hypothetical protein [Ensifer sp. WSM1721]
MTRDETIAFIYDLVSATFGGSKLPFREELASKKYIEPEYLEDALDKVTRLIAAKLELVPEKVSEDFETQEVVRQQTDKMVADMVLQVRNSLDALTRRA